MHCGREATVASRQVVDVTVIGLPQFAVEMAPWQGAPEVGWHAPVASKAHVSGPQLITGLLTNSSEIPVPLATAPQLPFTHGAPTQSLAVVHVVAHAEPDAAHLKGAHVTAGVGTQWPAPSHDDPAVA